uniref:Uncharacterized protein n=1 Tax=Arundo donax TaxID=35708 RepID=A0A0A9BXB3_ARUDO
MDLQHADADISLVLGDCCLSNADNFS